MHSRKHPTHRYGNNRLRYAFERRNFPVDKLRQYSLRDIPENVPSPAFYCWKCLRYFVVKLYEEYLNTPQNKVSSIDTSEGTSVANYQKPTSKAISNPTTSFALYAQLRSISRC